MLATVLLTEGRSWLFSKGQRRKTNGTRDILPCKQTSFSQGDKSLVRLEDGLEVGKSIDTENVRIPREKRREPILTLHHPRNGSKQHRQCGPFRD